MPLTSIHTSDSLTVTILPDFHFQELEISGSLDSLLGAMCEEDASIRMSLMHVLEVGLCSGNI